MQRSKRSLPAVALTVALVLSFGVVSEAGTTVIDVQLGESFTGTIAQAGVDTVEAQLSAAQGTVVTLKIRADSGTNLQPEATVLDPADATVALDGAFSISWLPVGNLVQKFTLPASGTYTIVIGGSSGQGGFWAEVSGTEPAAGALATLSGNVTNSLTGAPVAGVEVYAGTSLIAVTGAAGNYSAQLPAGDYALSFVAADFESSSQAIELTTGGATTIDVALQPVIVVGVDASVSGDAQPGATVTATAEIEAPPGTTIQSITWTKTYGPDVMIAGASTDTAMVTLPDTATFKAQLIEHLTEPPVTQDQLPENVQLTGEFHGGLQDRFQVAGINPFALEEAALVKLEVEVVTDLGTYTDEVEVHTALPWVWASGLRNVPIGSPVLLQGKEQGTYDWSLQVPNGSLATLADATTRNPYFTPDVSGAYTLTVTDETTEDKAPLVLEVFAGTWRGTIVGQDMDGRPVSDTACTFCHNGTIATDKFTDWRQTGHAEIFTNNLDTSTHYGDRCFACHTVGFDPATDNGGVDEAPDYDDFMGAGLINNPGDNWTEVLEQFPETARQSNIQCDNCHGPQDSFAHGFGAPAGEPRIDISSDVCATCHGEPLRHARFQQWQLSGHANYELAIDEGDSGSCSRCHTGNGFLAWLPVLMDDDPETDPAASVDVTWTLDEVHPQTCTTCHDPHAEGTTSGSNSNATVRISGDTPPLIAGFTATDVGGGAICMTCHNSRRGLRNDEVFDDLSASDKTRAPHGSAQTDLLMGQNAFFVEVGTPGGHGLLGDTCVDCHMNSTPPPDVLSYNQGGTNHTFYASETICADCHSPHLEAHDVQSGIEFLLSQVEDVFLGYVTNMLDDLFQAGYTVDVDGDVTLTASDQIEALALSESRGRQALIFTVGGTEYGPTSVANIDVLLGGVEAGQLYDFADPALPKAGWNYFLAHNDGSHGVHNPFFASGALSSARDALLAAEPSVIPETNKGSRGRRTVADIPEPVRSRTR